MARNLNKVQLIGNIGRDPDIQTTTSGTRVAHVSLATSRRISRNGGDFDERTEWHRLTLWDRLADVANDYLRKGDRVYVDGRIEYGSFEKNGVIVPTAEIVVQELILLGSPMNASSPADDAPSD